MMRPNIVCTMNACERILKHSAFTSQHSIKLSAIQKTRHPLLSRRQYGPQAYFSCLNLSYSFSLASQANAKWELMEGQWTKKQNMGYSFEGITIECLSHVNCLCHSLYRLILYVDVLGRSNIANNRTLHNIYIMFMRIQFKCATLFF